MEMRATVSHISKFYMTLLAHLLKRFSDWTTKQNLFFKIASENKMVQKLKRQKNTYKSKQKES